jgi:quinolinate synthase
MKSNTLEGILRVLLKPAPKDEVILDEDVRLRARRCIDAMFDYAENKVPAEIPS